MKAVARPSPQQSPETHWHILEMSAWEGTHSQGKGFTAHICVRRSYPASIANVTAKQVQAMAYLARLYPCPLSPLRHKCGRRVAIRSAWEDDASTPKSMFSGAFSRHARRLSRQPHIRKPLAVTVFN